MLNCRRSWILMALTVTGVGCGAATGVAPTTMNIMVDPQIYGSGIRAAVVQSDLNTGIFAPALSVNTGTPPAPLVVPTVAFPAYTFNEVQIGGVWYINPGYMGGADFAAVNKTFNIPGLAPYGRPGKWYLSALVYSSQGIQLRIGDSVTVGVPPATVSFTVTPTIAAHITAYTIAHELGWHVVGNHTLEGSGPPVHIGVNDWNVIIPPTAAAPGVPAKPLYITNGTFPPFLNAENEALQLQMGYLQ